MCDPKRTEPTQVAGKDRHVERSQPLQNVYDVRLGETDRRRRKKRTCKENDVEEKPERSAVRSLFRVGKEARENNDLGNEGRSCQSTRVRVRVRRRKAGQKNVP